MPKYIDELEKRVDEASDALDETLKNTTDNVKERVAGMSARVDSYLEDGKRRRRRDSHKALTAVKP